MATGLRVLRRGGHPIAPHASQPAPLCIPDTQATPFTPAYEYRTRDTATCTLILYILCTVDRRDCALLFTDSVYRSK